MSRVLNTDRINSLISVLPEFIADSRFAMDSIEKLLNDSPKEELPAKLADMLVAYDLFDEDVLFTVSGETG